MPNRSTSLIDFVFRVGVWLAILASAGATLAVSGQDESTRIVAVADIHGNADGFAAILQRASLLDAERQWIGGRATLVQTGDYTDRGPQVRDTMDLLMRLEQDAAAAGGRVVVLLGNHEVMNMMRDLRYVTPEIYATFADDRSTDRRERAFGQYLARLAAIGSAAEADTADAKAAWMAAYPPGYFAYQEAFDPDGQYGRWLRTKPVVAQVDNTIFLHGGIDPAASPLNFDDNNTQAAREIDMFDRYRHRLVEAQVLLPFSTFEETLRATRILLREVEAGAQLNDGPLQEALDGLADVTSWSIVNGNGPLWFRGFALWQPADGGSQISRLLTRYGASRFVVGHSILRSFRITPRFDARVFLIDTGMLDSYYDGGRASALEIQGDRITALYIDEEIVLVEP